MLLIYHNVCWGWLPGDSRYLSCSTFTSISWRLPISVNPIISSYEQNLISWYLITKNWLCWPPQFAITLPYSHYCCWSILPKIFKFFHNYKFTPCTSGVFGTSLPGCRLCQHLRFYLIYLQPHIYTPVCCVHKTTAKSEHQLHHVYPSACYFHETSHLGILLKFVSTFQFWLKVDKSNRSFTLSLLTFMIFCYERSSFLRQCSL